VPKLRRTGGTFGLAFAAYDAWLRLSPTQRRAVLAAARRYGPLIAAQAARSARAAAARRKP
jgi:predicted Fe-S protein YdhL (DUF1289 family)